MATKKKYAILGAGGGGQVMAAHLTMMGYDVNLYEHPDYKHVIDPVLEQDGIYLTGVLGRYFARPHMVTTDIKEAVRDVDIIVMVVPAFAQPFFFEGLIPVLQDGQIIIIQPGYLGSLMLSGLLRERNVKKVLVGEAQTMLYNSRNKGPAHAWTFGIKKVVQFGWLTPCFTL